MDNQGVWDGHVYTAVFKMDNQQGPIVWHMELCSVLPVSLDGSGGLGEKGYMYLYGLFTWNYHNIVNQLYPNKKIKIQKKPTSVL